MFAINIKILSMFIVYCMANFPLIFNIHHFHKYILKFKGDRVSMYLYLLYTSIKMFINPEKITCIFSSLQIFMLIQYRSEILHIFQIR